VVLNFGRSFTFETFFLKQFKEDKIPSTLALDLSIIKMDPKGKVIYFNQCFLNLLKKIPRASKPTKDFTIEFYTLSLPMSMVMFVKNMLSLKGNIEEESLKDKYNTNTKPLLPILRKKKKDINSMDMESLQRIFNKLSNELIDLKYNSGEGSSNPKNSG